MFCGYCGQQNPDDSLFCSNCGASLQPSPAANTPVTGVSDFGGSRGPDSRTIKIICAAAGGVAVLVLLIVLLVNALGGGETKPVKTFLTGLETCNVEKMLSVFPDEVMDEADLDKSDIRDLQEELEDIMDDEDVKISFEIKDTKDVKRSALRELQELYDDEYDLEVTDARTIKAKVTAEVDGDKEKETMEFGVVKIGGKWYMDIHNSGGLFYSVINGSMF